MKFSHPQADVYVPGGALDPHTALAKVSHLCVAAHQDDIEIMAYAGICDCLEKPNDRAFGGVVVTNGAGSPRTGAYATLTDPEMQAVRQKEQRSAAQLGGYSIQIQLAHPSSDVKQAGHAGVADDLDRIFRHCRPDVVYLHNPADKHDTHIAVLSRCLESLRRLPMGRRPTRIIGCEVWRDLDWVLDGEKIALDSGRRPELADALLKVFDSQIAGGKRYDAATIGRRCANATYHSSHATDVLQGITWAVDLTPLLADSTRTLADFAAGSVERLKQDVIDRIRRLN